VTDDAGRRAPDFSTGFWKEFKLRYPRPAVYVPVGVAYLLLFAVLMIFMWSPAGVVLFLLVPAALCFSVVPALAVSRRFASRRERLALRESLAGVSVARREGLRRRWCRRQLLRALVAPGLALGLMLPFCLTAGSMMHEYSVGLGMGLLCGLVLWLDAAAMVILAAAGGAAGALAGPARWAARRAFLAMLLALLVRGVLLFFVYLAVAGTGGPGAGSYNLTPAEGSSDFDAYLIVPLVDALLCALAGGVVLLTVPALLAGRLARPEPEYASDEEVIADAPEGLGLGISFWALVKWRFREDPFYRAEKRNLWNARRLTITWIVVILGALGAPFLGKLAGILGPAAGTLVAGFLSRLPVWIAPAVMAVGMCAEKKSGALESLLLTPAAPLRLAAAKLVGRASHLWIAALAAAAVGSMVCCAGGMARSYADGDVFMYAFLSLFSFLAVPLSVLAYGAVGLYFATRQKTLLGALVLTYAAVGLFDVACGWGLRLSAEVFLSSRSYFGGYAWYEVIPFVLAALQLMAIGVLLRVFLPAAARQLVLRRGE